MNSSTSSYMSDNKTRSKPRSAASSSAEMRSPRFSDLANRDIPLAELGVRGSFRLMQTLGAVYPRAIRLLMQWRKPEPREVRELFEALGATYIKVGQFIASSPSVFPKEYVEEFQKLLDQTEAIPFRKIKRIIEDDLGKPMNRVYEWVDERPLASASIAQVHAARLITGEDVVIKVQKPGVAAILTTDLNAAYLLSRLFELMVPHLDKDAIAGIVSEMYQCMIEECDFNKEADNLNLFIRFLQDTGNNEVVAPRPYLQATNTRVLTMERLYGTAISRPGEAQQSIAAERLFIALNTWFASLQSCDIFHADLHSGNLLLLDNGKVGFIDFGMVGRIKTETWQATSDLIAGLSEEDYHRIARAMLSVGLTRESIDVDRLAADVKKVFGELYSIEPSEMLLGDGNEIDGVTRMMNSLGDLAKSYGIRFPRAFTMLLKQFLYFDRYMDMLAPGVDLFDDERITLF